jgi:hypothetical protein
LVTFECVIERAAEVTSRGILLFFMTNGLACRLIRDHYRMTNVTLHRDALHWYFLPQFYIVSLSKTK